MSGNVSALSSAANFSQPPWIRIPGVANFRDIGGYPVEDGSKSVKKGLVFRSAEPSKITEEGKQKLRKLGIRKVYDLRSEPELNRLGDMAKIVEMEGIERCFIPVHRSQDYSPEALATRYEQYMTGDLQSAYRNILNGDPTAYRTIFTNLLQDDPDPFLIHCTAGKDRTGIICALILLLAGVSEDVIANEYALTTAGLEEMREKIIEYLMKDKDSMAGNGRERAENMLSSKAETMQAFLEIVKSEFGGVKGYMQTILKFNPEEVEKIRKNVITPEKPNVAVM